MSGLKGKVEPGDTEPVLAAPLVAAPAQAAPAEPIHSVENFDHSMKIGNRGTESARGSSGDGGASSDGVGGHFDSLSLQRWASVEGFAPETCRECSKTLDAHVSLQRCWLPS